MKLRIERDALADAVAWAARTLPSKPTYPVLSGVLLVAGEDRVQLSSTDQAVSSQVGFDAEIAEPGEVVVSGKLLADIAKALPAQPVSIVLEGSRLVADLRAGVLHPADPAGDGVPRTARPPADPGQDLGLAFADAVAQVAFAASRDDTLPVLTGIRLELGPERIAMAATDRYRLALREVPWQPARASVEANVLVRAKTLSDLARPLASAATVDLSLDDGLSTLGLTGGSRRSTSPLLDGDFPDYRKLLPAESLSVATLATGELIEAVKRVKLVVDRPSAPILFEFTDGEVLLRAGAGEDAQASESLEAGLSGESIKIAFNPDYLLEGLSALGSPTARVAMTQPNRPAVVSGDDEELAYRYLLMPVRLAG